MQLQLLSERLEALESVVRIPLDGYATDRGLIKDLVSAQDHVNYVLPKNTKTLERRLRCLENLCQRGLREYRRNDSLFAWPNFSLAAKTKLIVAGEARIKDTVALLAELDNLLEFCDPPTFQVGATDMDLLKKVELNQNLISNEVRAGTRKVEDLLVEYNEYVDDINRKLLDLKAHLDNLQDQTSSISSALNKNL